MSASRLWLLIIPLALACEETVYVPVDGQLPAPANFAYQLEPSGDPSSPAGILLSWDGLDVPDLGEYRVYSRGSTGGRSACAAPRRRTPSTTTACRTSSTTWWRRT